jgi:hypothetical protein
VATTVVSRLFTRTRCVRMAFGSTVSTRGPSWFSPKPRTLCAPPA